MNRITFISDVTIFSRKEDLLRNLRFDPARQDPPIRQDLKLNVEASVDAVASGKLTGSPRVAPFSRTIGKGEFCFVAGEGRSSVSASIATRVGKWAERFHSLAMAPVSSITAGVFGVRWEAERHTAFFAQLCA